MDREQPQRIGVTFPTDASHAKMLKVLEKADWSAVAKLERSQVVAPQREVDVHVVPRSRASHAIVFASPSLPHYALATAVWMAVKAGELDRARRPYIYINGQRKVIVVNRDPTEHELDAIKATAAGYLCRPRATGFFKLAHALRQQLRDRKVQEFLADLNSHWESRRQPRRR